MENYMKICAKSALLCVYTPHYDLVDNKDAYNIYCALFGHLVKM